MRKLKTSLAPNSIFTPETKAKYFDARITKHIDIEAKRAIHGDLLFLILLDTMTHNPSKSLYLRRVF